MATLDPPELSPPDWEAAKPRLAALQRLGLKNLPTARLVRWNYFSACFTGGLALLFLVVGGVGILTVLFGVVAIVELLHGTERARSIRTGNIGTGRIERLFDSRLSETGGTAVGVLTAVLTRSPDDVTEAAGDLIPPAAAEILSGRKAHSLERLMKRLPTQLGPNERPLVVVPAILMPHGWQRARMWMTLGIGLLASMRGGLLTVTDRRLVFVSRRVQWSELRVLFAEPVADLTVLEWFKGIGATERLHSILILRRPNGQIARLQVSRLWWGDEGRTAFELLASISEHRPPAALEAYWRRPGVSADIAPKP